MDFNDVAAPPPAVRMPFQGLQDRLAVTPTLKDMRSARIARSRQLNRITSQPQVSGSISGTAISTISYAPYSGSPRAVSPYRAVATNSRAVSPFRAVAAVSRAASPYPGSPRAVATNSRGVMAYASPPRAISPFMHAPRLAEVATPILSVVPVVPLPPAPDAPRPDEIEAKRERLAQEIAAGLQQASEEVARRVQEEKREAAQKAVIEKRNYERQIDQYVKDQSSAIDEEMKLGIAMLQQAAAIENGQAAAPQGSISIGSPPVPQSPWAASPRPPSRMSSLRSGSPTLMGSVGSITPMAPFVAGAPCRASVISSLSPLTATRGVTNILQAAMKANSPAPVAGSAVFSRDIATVESTRAVL